MTTQKSDNWIAAEHAPKGGILSLLADHFIGEAFDSEKRERISDGDFKWLMALVVVAAFTFGCIVNGWVI